MEIEVYLGFITFHNHITLICITWISLYFTRVINSTRCILFIWRINVSTLFFGWKIIFSIRLHFNFGISSKLRTITNYKVWKKSIAMESSIKFVTSWFKIFILYVILFSSISLLIHYFIISGLYIWIPSAV